MSWINWFFTMMHSLAAIKMIIVSLRFRSFLYGIPDESVPKSLRAAPSSNHSPSKRRRLLQRPIQVVHLLFGHQGLFGIQGKHYVTIFLLKESVRMVLHSHQASKLSAVVARPALVRAFVALVILQCCSTPFIHRRFGHAGGQERMWYVFCDVFVCFITTIVIPAVLAIPYLSQYDPQTRNFPIHSYQNSVWFSVMVTELQRILVASWVDVITRIFMSVSILASLGDAKLLLARSRRCLPPQPGQVSPPKRMRRAKQSLEQVLHVVMFIFGVAVFIVHLRAELHGHEMSCVLPVRPWLSAKAGCSLFVLNCTKKSTQGGLLEMTRVLSNFEARTLQTLELVSCPQLHVPPIIQSFHQLANFKILSSNVTSWDVDAALTAANHPRLISFAAYNVNMPGGELPLGMQDPHFPPTLRTLHLSGMNVQTLPVTFPSMWPQAMFLMYEFCNLTVVPPVLTRMSSMVLSLAGNQLTDVPPELFYVMPLMNLDLSGNPLTNLPEIPASLIAQLGHPAPILYVLDLMYTRLESLPSWFSSLYRVKASFTPLCTKVMSGELSVIPLGSSPFYLDCVSADEIGMG